VQFAWGKWLIKKNQTCGLFFIAVVSRETILRMRHGQALSGQDKPSP
jgi:hypothetical protein